MTKFKIWDFINVNFYEVFLSVAPMYEELITAWSK